MCEFCKFCYDINKYTVQVLRQKIYNVTNSILNKIEKEKQELELKLKKNELERKFLETKLAECD